MTMYGQYMGPAGQFIVPQYSADGTLLGAQTRHHEPSDQAAGPSGSRSGRDIGHRAKDQRTGVYQGSSEPARGDRRGATVEPPRQSPFTEVRGKRQQYDVVDVSDDDDDDFADGDDPRVQQSESEDIDVPVLQRDDDVLDDATIVRRAHHGVKGQGVLDGAASVRRAHHGVADDGGVIDDGAVTTQWSGEEIKVQRMQQVPFQSWSRVVDPTRFTHLCIRQVMEDIISRLSQTQELLMVNSEQ